MSRSPVFSTLHAPIRDMRAALSWPMGPQGPMRLDALADQLALIIGGQVKAKAEADLEAAQKACERKLA